VGSSSLRARIASRVSPQSPFGEEVTREMSDPHRKPPAVGLGRIHESASQGRARPPWGGEDATARPRSRGGNGNLRVRCSRRRSRSLHQYRRGQALTLAAESSKDRARPGNAVGAVGRVPPAGQELRGWPKRWTIPARASRHSSHGPSRVALVGQSAAHFQQFSAGALRHDGIRVVAPDRLEQHLGVRGPELRDLRDLSQQFRA